jgi:hypothetical protein
MAVDQVIIARGRLSNASKWFAHRGWDVLPQNERGRSILRWGADHAWLAGPDNPKRSVRRWCRKHAPWLTDAELEQIVRETETSNKRWTGDQSAAVLEIGVRDREALHLWFFGADDDPAYERRNARKREKAAARARKSRAARSTGRPRGRPALDLSPEEKAARIREQNAERQRRRRASCKKPSRDIIDIGTVTHLSVTLPKSPSLFQLRSKCAERLKRDGADHRPIVFEGDTLPAETGGCAKAPPPPMNQFPPAWTVTR